MRGCVYKIRKARKEYRCTERNYHVIAKGDSYLYGCIPPEHEANRSRKKWEYTRACVRCAVHYGMLDSDMRKQLGIKS